MLRPKGVLSQFQLKGKTWTVERVPDLRWPDEPYESLFGFFDPKSRRIKLSGDMSQTIKLFDRFPAEIARDFGISTEAAQDFSKRLFSVVEQVEPDFNAASLAAELSIKFSELIGK